MEYLEFANDITPLKITGVVVNSDGTSKPFDLREPDISKVLLMSLDEMREYLCQESLVLIGRQNTNFRNAFENKIPLARESECKLKDILVPTNEEAQDGSYSFYLEKDLRMPGFPEIVDRLHIDKGFKKTENGNIVSANESAFRIRRPHMMDVIIDQKLEQHNAGPGRKLLILKKGSIRLLQEDLEPTKEYIDAVRNALNHSENNQEQREALVRVGEEFGFFWSKEVELGGKLYVNDGQANNIDGLEILRLFKNWKIIEHNELLSLYNLLPQELILRIKKVIGMKLLHHEILSIQIPRNRDSITKKIPKPQVISTFRGVKIFTSAIVMNNARPYRNVIGIRVDYMDDDNPYIVVHRIGPAKNYFELSIPWMLIGYAEDLPIEPFKDYPVDYIWTKNFQYDTNNANIQTFEHPYLNFEEYCWLGTCILKYNDNPAYNFGHSNDVISYNFRNNAANNGTKICCYQYDLQNNLISNTLKFKANCAIISDTPDFEVVSPVNHEWDYRPCMLQYLLRNSHTFTGNKWQLPTLSKCVFASIHYSDFRGNPLILNIHKKYPIVKSLDNVSEDLNALVGYVKVVR